VHNHGVALEFAYFGRWMDGWMDGWQSVALTGRKLTLMARRGVSTTRAAGRPARPPSVLQTTIDANEQNDTGPLRVPVII